MQEIVEAFKRNQFSFDDLVNYHTWVHQEDVLDEEEHNKMQVDLDHQWQTRFRDPNHHDLSLWPSYLHHDAEKDGVETESQCFQGVETDALLKEGSAFSRVYKQDAQRIFSRVQHHMHKWTKGGYVPLKTCKAKSGSSKQCYSEGFPVKQIFLNRNPFALNVCYTSILFSYESLNVALTITGFIKEME